MIKSSKLDPSVGIFSISSTSKLTGVSIKSLRLYEAKGVIKPKRSEGNRRLYSDNDITLLRFVHYWAAIKKVNIAGIKVILELIKLIPEPRRLELIYRVESLIVNFSYEELKAFKEGEPIVEENIGGNPPENYEPSPSFEDGAIKA